MTNAPQKALVTPQQAIATLKGQLNIALAQRAEADEKIVTLRSQISGMAYMDDLHQQAAKADAERAEIDGRVTAESEDAATLAAFAASDPSLKGESAEPTKTPPPPPPEDVAIVKPKK